MGIKEFAHHYQGPEGGKLLLSELERGAAGAGSPLSELANRFIGAAREGIFYREGFHEDGPYADPQQTTFSDHRLEAGGILLGSIILELEDANITGNFSLRAVVSTFNEAIRGTEVPQLHIPELNAPDGHGVFITLPDEMIKRLDEDIAKDKTRTRAVYSLMNFKVLGDFLDKNEALQAVHEAAQIWRVLANDTLPDDELSSLFSPSTQQSTESTRKLETTGGQKLLKEGEYEILPEGEDARIAEMRKRGFTPEQIAALLKFDTSVEKPPKEKKPDSAVPPRTKVPAQDEKSTGPEHILLSGDMDGIPTDDEMRAAGFSPSDLRNVTGFTRGQINNYLGLIAKSSKDDGSDTYGPEGKQKPNH